MKNYNTTIQKHSAHNTAVIYTPGKIHYAKLCCADCGNVFLQWLSADDLVKIGNIDETQKQELIKSKKPKIEQLQQQGKYKSKKSDWSNITAQERDFYKSYQPSSQKGRTPSQLIGDRLCLVTESKYNGNSLYSIPVKYLELIMAQNKITNTDDKNFIMAIIKKRTGADLSPPESNN
jgi:hypothetical protein